MVLLMVRLRQLEEIEVFTASAEARLAMHLRRGTIPDEDLVEAISVCKVLDRHTPLIDWST